MRPILGSHTCAQHSVAAVRGSKARKAFFDDRRLDSIEGYKILMGAVRYITALHFASLSSTSEISLVGTKFKRRGDRDLDNR